MVVKRRARVIGGQSWLRIAQFLFGAEKNYLRTAAYEDASRAMMQPYLRV